MKGKQHPLNNDSDISTMYAAFKKKHILFWIKCVSRLKRPSSKSDLDSAPKPKRSTT